MSSSRTPRTRAVGPRLGGRPSCAVLTLQAAEEEPTGISDISETAAPAPASPAARRRDLGPAGPAPPPRGHLCGWASPPSLTWDSTAQNELRGQSKALWVDASRPDSAGGHSGAGGHGGEDLGPVQRRPFLSAASCHNQGIRTSLSAVLRSTTGSSDARWASRSCPAGGHRGPRGQEGASALRISPSSGVCRDVGLQVPDPPAPQSFSLVNQNPREPAWESRR